MTPATLPTETANGTRPTGLPVDTFRDAAPFLRRPFTPDAVKFKPQSVKNGKTLVVAYFDVRLVIERLNLVCPHLWSDRYEPTPGGLMWCHLTVDGITRSDVGEGIGKNVVTDALKRAAVKFGVGVSVKAIPMTFLEGEIKYMDAAATKLCRERYSAWLDAVGREQFGDPFDHGDTGDGQDEDAPVPDGEERNASVEQIAAIHALFPQSALTPEDFHALLDSVGVGQAESAAQRVAGASAAQALAVAKALEVHARSKSLVGANS